jgi:hypothetical protein
MEKYAGLSILPIKAVELPPVAPRILDAIENLHRLNAMSGFTLIPPPNYVAELLSLAPSFGASEEYQSLDPEDRINPSTAFSAFAKFMESSFGNQSIIEECRIAIEHFAAATDAEAHNLLVTEIFEAFRLPDLSRNALLPLSRALYDGWMPGFPKWAQAPQRLGASTHSEES